MKRILLLLVLFISLTAGVALAGHVKPSGRACEPCDNVTCICDPGEIPIQGRAATDSGSMVLLAVALVLIVARLKS